MFCSSVRQALYSAWNRETELRTDWEGSRWKGVCCPLALKERWCYMARLAQGVRKRPDGTLEKRFTVDGKRYSIYGANNKELQQKEKELRAQIEAGTYTDNRNLTLDKYFEEWLAGKRNSTKGNTLKTYRSHYYKHISPRLGNKKIQKIERREILVLQREIFQGLSESTCNGVLRTLKIILNDAVHDEIISKNPADGVKALKETEKATETYHRALTGQEQKEFMREMEKDFYYEFVALLLCTGMRSGEAAALTWSDIDYKQNVIHITKTVTYNEDGTIGIGSPKSESGKRDIPLNGTIRSVLSSQRKKLGNILPMNDNRVFVSVYGGIIHNHAINRAINGALSRLREKGRPIEHFTAHALRDTFATRFIEQGGNPQTLKVILGHSSLAMTMDLYSHVLPNTKQQEMDNLRIVL